MKATRSQQMVALFIAGNTLQIIGDKFGLTRERVRQILVQERIVWNSGGAHVRKKIKADNIRKAQDARYLANWGHTRSEHLRISKLPKNPILAFRCQRNNAKRRGICWHFSFPEWWQIWQDSGKWALRGVKSLNKNYVMARFGDVGPYSKDNVFIQIAIDNLMDGKLRRYHQIKPLDGGQERV